MKKVLKNQFKKFAVLKSCLIFALANAKQWEVVCVINEYLLLEI